MDSPSQKLLLIIDGKNKGARKALGEVSSDMSATTKVAGVVGAGMVAVGALVGKGLGVATKAAAEYGSQVVLIQRLTGESAEESSKWAAILGRYGVEGTKATLVVKSLTTAIAEDSEALHEVGIATRDAEGGYRSSTEVLADLAEKYATAEDKTQILAVASKTLGRGFSALLPLLAGGKKNIDDLSVAAKKNGLILSQDALTGVKAYNKALKDNEEAIKGLTVQLGLATLPYETFKTKTIGGLIAKLRELNPELVETGAAVVDIGADVAKAGGSALIFIAAIPEALKGLAWLGARVGSIWETTKIVGLYAAEAIGGIGTALTFVAPTVVAGIGMYKALADEQDRLKTDPLRGLRTTSTTAGVANLSAELSVSAGRFRSEENAVGRVANVLPPFTTNLGRHATAQTSAGTATKATALTMEKEADAAEGASDAVDKQVRSLQGLLVAETDLEGRKRTAKDAELAYRSALLDSKDAHAAVNKLVKEGKKGTEEYRRALIDQERAELALADATQINREEQHKLNEAFVTGGDKTKALTAEGEKWTEKLNKATDRVGALTAKLETVPKSKQTEIKAEIAKAQANVDKIKAQIAGIKDKSVTITVTMTDRFTAAFTTRFGNLSLSLPQGQAEGGVYRSATVGIFGEASPRLGEYLVNADRLAAGDVRQRELALSLIQHMPVSVDRSIRPARQGALGPVSLHVAENARFILSSDMDVQRVSTELAEDIYAELKGLGIVT